MKLYCSENVLRIEDKVSEIEHLKAVETGHSSVCFLPCKML